MDKYIERDIDGNIIGIYSYKQYDDEGEEIELETLNETSQDWIDFQSIKDKADLIKEKQILICDLKNDINRYLSQNEAGISTTLTITEFNNKVSEKETLHSDILTIESEIETLMENIRT